MRLMSLAWVALLGTAAYAFGGPSVLAGGVENDAAPFGLDLPSSIAPGGRMDLHLDRSQCQGLATIASGIFDTVKIPKERDTASVTVNSGARPGAAYRITVDCDGTSRSRELTIASGGGGIGGGIGNAIGGVGNAVGGVGSTIGGVGNAIGEVGPDGTGPQPVPLPVTGGVDAGVGGGSRGLDLQEIGFGALLVAGSIGAAHRVARRRGTPDGG